MDIIHGLYRIADWTYGVIGISTDTETLEQCVFCQQLSGPFRSAFFLVPLTEFVGGMGKDQILLERDNAPTLRAQARIPEDIVPGLYGHFKNKANTYNVIVPAIHTKEGIQMVVYQPLYGEQRYLLRHRPRAMFFERVVKPERNYSGPRFFLMDAYEAPHIAAVYQD